MSKVDTLSSKNREQRNSRHEQRYVPSQEQIRLDASEFYAFVESASERAVKYAVRDYVDSKDFVTNKRLDERLAASERYIIAELRNEISDLGTTLRQEMGQMGNKMLGGFGALAALVTFLAWIGGAFSKAEPQQSTQYVPVPYSLEQLLAPKAPVANP